MAEDKKINTLIEESGMITHFKTSNILRKGEWSVLVSPYYYDSISDSIRETDLIAEKQFYSSVRLDNSSVQVNIQLFIECKYIKQEIAFWFDNIDKDKAVENLENEVDLRIMYNRSGADIALEKFHTLHNDSVAKLFSTNTNKEDVMYKAMNQCLHSQINYRKTGKKLIFNKHSDFRGSRSQIVQYPVIICDNFDNLNKVNFNEVENFETEKLKNHFVLETNYREDYFLIDVVDILFLDQFLTILDEEARAILDSHVHKAEFGRRTN